MKELGRATEAGVERTMERQYPDQQSRHREGEHFSYILAAVIKDLMRGIFQQEGLFQAYSLRRDRQ